MLEGLGQCMAGLKQKVQRFFDRSLKERDYTCLDANFKCLKYKSSPIAPCNSKAFQ